MRCLVINIDVWPGRITDKTVYTVSAIAVVKWQQQQVFVYQRMRTGANAGFCEWGYIYSMASDKGDFRFRATKPAKGL